MPPRRIDFSQATKDIIAQRAAYRCSYPGCNTLLIGPDVDPAKSLNLGECAHIYSAAPDGPRGRGKLTDEQLSSHSNGIFLCHKHHRLIDRKSNIARYPSSRLLYYKSLHEHNISRELGFLQHPMLWIQSITILQAPFFSPGTTFNLAQANILYGSNSTGKSLTIEMLYCALSGQCIPRFKDTTIIFELSLSNPVLDKVTCTITHNSVYYDINGHRLSFSPFNIDVIFIHNLNPHPHTKGDDIDFIQRFVYLTRNQIKNIIQAIDLTHGYFASRLRLDIKRSRPYETIDLRVTRRDERQYGSEPWHFCQLSGSEQISIIFDLMINHVRAESQYRNIIMLVDNIEMDLFSQDGQNHFIELLQNNAIHFQSIITAVKDHGFSAQPGWNIIHLPHTPAHHKAANRN